LQKRPTILSILLTVATPYFPLKHTLPFLRACALAFSCVRVHLRTRALSLARALSLLHAHALSLREESYTQSILSPSALIFPCARARVHARALFVSCARALSCARSRLYERSFVRACALLRVRPLSLPRAHSLAHTCTLCIECYSRFILFSHMYTFPFAGECMCVWCV